MSHIVEKGGGIEEETVHAVEHAAMTGNQRAAVLDAGLPFEQRFREIADNARELEKLFVDLAVDHVAAPLRSVYLRTPSRPAMK